MSKTDLVIVYYIYFVSIDWRAHYFDTCLDMLKLPLAMTSLMMYFNVHCYIYKHVLYIRLSFSVHDGQKLTMVIYPLNVLSTIPLSL